MEAIDFSLLQPEIDELIEYELYDSADDILCLFVSRQRTQRTHCSQMPLVFEYQGNVCKLKLEYKRASSYYEQALQSLCFQNVTASQTASGTVIDSPAKARLMFKLCKCQYLASNDENCLSQLEKVPPSLRNPAINMLLQKYYKNRRYKDDELSVLQSVISQLPCALEIIEYICNNFYDFNVHRVLQDALKFKNLSNHSWLIQITDMLSSRRNCDYSRFKDTFDQLSAFFPSNYYLNCLAGKTWMECTDWLASKERFQLCHSYDSFSLRNMDYYAYALYSLGDKGELMNLITHLQQINENSKEYFLAAALRSVQSTTDSDHPNARLSFKLFEKATKMDPKYHFSFVLKAVYFLSENDQRQALIAFQQAHSLYPTILSSRGLIEVYLRLQRNQEASRHITLAQKMHPNSAVVHYLLAKVCSSLGKFAEAGPLYQTAMRLNPRSVEVATSYSTFLIERKEESEAMKVLIEILHHTSTPDLRILYAQLLLKEKRSDEAIEQLHLSEAVQPSQKASALFDSIAEYQQQSDFHSVSNGSFSFDYEEVPKHSDRSFRMDHGGDNNASSSDLSPRNQLFRSDSDSSFQDFMSDPGEYSPMALFHD